MVLGARGAGASHADKPDGGFNEIDVDCDLVEGRSGDTDSNGRYTSMSVSLEVTDKDGDKNQHVSKRQAVLRRSVRGEEDDDD